MHPMLWLFVSLCWPSLPAMNEVYWILSLGSTLLELNVGTMYQDGTTLLWQYQLAPGGYWGVAKEVYIFEPAYSSVNSRLCEAAAFSSSAECKTTGRWDESVTCCELAGLHGLAWLGLESRNPLCGKGSLQWMRSSHLSASPFNKVYVIHRVTTGTQTCQNTRIRRETHGIHCVLTVSRPSHGMHQQEKKKFFLKK